MPVLGERLAGQDDRLNVRGLRFGRTLRFVIRFFRFGGRSSVGGILRFRESTASPAPAARAASAAFAISTMPVPCGSLRIRSAFDRSRLACFRWRGLAFCCGSHFALGCCNRRCLRRSFAAFSAAIAIPVPVPATSAFTVLVARRALVPRDLVEVLVQIGRAHV